MTAADSSARTGGVARGPWPRATLATVLAAVILHRLGAFAEPLELTAAGLLGGEVYRLWSAHLLHFSGPHLLWNVLALGALGAVAERVDRRTVIRILLWGAPTIGALVIAFDGDIERYRGLSGLATALFAFVATRFATASEAGSERAIGRVALALLGFKLVTELGSAEPLFAAAEGQFRNVPVAHMAGAAIGVAQGLAGRADRRRRRPGIARTGAALPAPRSELAQTG